MSHTSIEYLIGVDGGGTGCRVAISRIDGRLVAEASGGPANVTSDFEAALRNVISAIENARRQAGLSDTDLLRAGAHIGLAGVLGVNDEIAVAERLPFTQCRVSDDRLTSVIGALGSRDGALISVGTGSFVASRQGSGVGYLGGWGLQIGDQASGAWLGRALLTHCVLVCDGLRDGSDLTHGVLERFNASAGEMTKFAKDAQPSDYATFAPQIVSAATQGDPIGCALMQKGADYLNTCLTKVGLKEADVVCITGGLGGHYAPLLASDVRGKITSPIGSALDGALMLAKRAFAQMT